MEVDSRFPRRKTSRQEYYNIGRSNVKTYGYQNGNIHIQTIEQGKTMTRDEQYLHILWMIMTQYRLTQGMVIFFKQEEEAIKKELTQLHNMTNFLRMDTGILKK